MDTHGNGIIPIAEIASAADQLFPETCSRAIGLEVLRRAYRAVDVDRTQCINGRRHFRLLFEYISVFSSLWHDHFDAGLANEELGAAEFEAAARRAMLTVPEHELWQRFEQLVEEGDGNGVPFDSFCSWCAQQIVGETKGLWPQPQSASTPTRVRRAIRCVRFL
jgi:hypothetical protein